MWWWGEARQESSALETFTFTPCNKSICVYQCRAARLSTQQSFSLPEIMDTRSQQHIFSAVVARVRCSLLASVIFICMLPSLGVYKYTPVIHIYLYITISNATKEHYCRVNFVSTKEMLRSFPVAKTGLMKLCIEK